MFRLLISLWLSLLLCTQAMAQVNLPAYNQVKDSLIARFNRNDFKGIYALADTAFTHGVSEDRLVNYLKSIRNGGNVIRVISQEETRGGMAYLLELEARDMRLFLKLTSNDRFSSFGLANVRPPLLAVAPSIHSTNPLVTELDRSVDSLVRDYFRDPIAVGLSIGLIKDGKTYMYQYGETRKGARHVSTSLTRYEIGSITKTFTATLLAQAVLDHKVKLTDDIRLYLPGDFPNLQYANYPIRIQDLANHTARLPSMPANIGEQAGYNPLTPEVNYDSALFYQALRTVRLDTVPGYKFDYSNWGMAVLGQVLENAYQQPYAHLLEHYVTTPLGMVHTTYQLADEDKKQMASPYGENSKPIPFQNGGILGPAGAIHADLTDMVRYLQAQLVEKDPAIKLTHQLTRNNTGLGWGVRTIGQQRDIQHNGSTPGFTSHISGFPELNSGCVILANSKANMSRLIAHIQAMLKRS